MTTTLPRMGAPFMPSTCHWCTFFEAEAPYGRLDYMRTYCTIDPERRRETPAFVAMNSIDYYCPLWEEDE